MRLKPEFLRLYPLRSAIADVQGILTATRPASFRCPSPRGHILGITQGIGFLENPTPIGIGWHRLTAVRAQWELLRSDSPFGVPLESSYPPGLMGGNLGHCKRCQAPSLYHFWSSLLVHLEGV